MNAAQSAVAVPGPTFLQLNNLESPAPRQKLVSISEVGVAVGYSTEELLARLEQQRSSARPAEPASTECLDDTAGNLVPAFQDLQSQQAERGRLLARRRFQRGSVELKGDKWVAQWREDELRPGTNEPYRVHHKKIIGTKKDFPTKRLAQRELDRLLADVNNPTYQPAVAITFAEFAAQWKANVLSHMAPSTQSSETSRLNNLLAFFNAFRLRDIQPQTVQSFVTSCCESGTSPKTIRNAVMTLRSMWKTAKTWGHVTHDVFEGLRLPELEESEQPYFTLEQMQQIINAAQEPYQTMYWLAAETGMRAGEVCGLQWPDVQQGYVTVVRSVWRNKKKSPKTRTSKRSFAISPELQARLEGIRQPSGYVFQSRNDTPRIANDIQKRHLVPLLKRLGLPQAGWHAFRHGNETIMDRGLEQPIPVALRLARLGHSDTRMMVNYSHVVSEDDRGVAAELGRLLAPKSEVLERFVADEEKGLDAAIV